MTTVPGTAAWPSRHQSPAEVRRELWRVYLGALPRYVVPTGILARSLKQVDDRWELTEPCALNTAEALKTAFALEYAGVTHGLDARAVLDRVMRDHIPAADHQVVALTLWAASLGQSPHAAELARLLETRVPTGVSQSMPLAWALSALCAYADAFGTKAEVRAFATSLYQRLSANQNANSGLFHASARREGWLRRRVADTTLSSQTYPIYAFARFARLFETPDALTLARRCADRLSALQGPKGQWWWRYDASKGTVGSGYPVYAVNQDGAVPLALGALQAGMGDRRYDAAVNRGLSWEGGDNELSRSLIDGQHAIVARCVETEGASYRLMWEMYAYQPSRARFAMLSEKAWLGEAMG